LAEAGSYILTDAAYAKLIHRLDGHCAELPPELRTKCRFSSLKKLT
jgi:hypothetical protein